MMIHKITTQPLPSADSRIAIDVGDSSPQPTADRSFFLAQSSHIPFEETPLGRTIAGEDTGKATGAILNAVNGERRDAVPLLKKIAADPSKMLRVRARAATAVHNLGDKQEGVRLIAALESELDESSQEMETIVLAWFGTGRVAAYPHLMKIMKPGHDFSARWRAMSALACIFDEDPHGVPEETLKELRAVAGDKKEPLSLRLHAAMLLVGTFHDNEAISIVGLLVSDPRSRRESEYEAWFEVMEALGEEKDKPKAVQVLLEQLHNPGRDEHEKKFILKMIADFKTGWDCAPVVKLIDDGPEKHEPQVLINAAAALAARGDKAAVPSLQKLLSRKDIEPVVREAAEKAIAKLK